VNLKAILFVCAHGKSLRKSRSRRHQDEAQRQRLVLVPLRVSSSRQTSGFCNTNDAVLAPGGQSQTPEPGFWRQAQVIVQIIVPIKRRTTVSAVKG
jgi:hypothetical protein